jgi:hypothetical protein
MRLRVIDFGTVPALTSQALYHGIATTVTAGSDPLLLLSSPSSPYVCVGMHQEIGKEVDEDYCRTHGLPIYRRHIGGGAVYLDRNQLFTHFIYPRGKAPEFARNLYPLFIEPVVRTYRDFGIDAAYRPINDIQVAGGRSDDLGRFHMSAARGHRPDRRGAEGRGARGGRAGRRGRGRHGPVRHRNAWGGPRRHCRRRHGGGRPRRLGR